MSRFRKKAIEIEAMRYGKDDDGRWYPGAVQRIAQFMLGVEADVHLTDGQICEVVRPTGLWDPPASADLEMWDGVAHGKWLPLAPGDWVIRGVQGEFYPCKPVIFDATYEPAMARGGVVSVGADVTSYVNAMKRAIKAH